MQALPSTTEIILLLVGCVNNGLGVGHVVHGGNASMHNAQPLMDDLDNRRQAVCCAGRGCDNVVLCSIICALQ